MWRENEKVRITSRPSPLGAEAFGIPGVTKPDGRVECQKWETCRDRFRSSGAKLPQFWFRTGPQSGENISAFFDKIETALKIKKKSNFGPTSCSDAIWVRWAPFWRKYSMRRSLFTALLRVALQYNRETDNFEETLQADLRYLRTTRPAFDYFMEGNTVYTGGNVTAPGWQSVFYNKTKAQLPALLRKPVKPASP